MKKRLLSAALALAMVLTMLPLSVAPAFAAATPPSPPSTGTVTNITWVEFTGDFAPTAVTYYAAGSTYQGYTIQTSGWYSAVMRNAAGANVCYFAPEATGVITAAIPSTGWANGNSGTLYPSVTRAAERGATSVTLLGSGASLDVNMGTSYSMSINLNGQNLGISSGTTNPTNRLTQLTLTNTAAAGTATGAISVTNRSFTLNNGNTNGTYPVNANGLNLTLTNTQTAGTAWGTGALTVNSYGGSLGAISTSNAKGTIRATNGGTISSITLGTVTEKDNRSGGSVTLETRAKVTSNLTIIGTGSLKLSGASQADGVYLYGGSSGNTTAGTVPTWNGTTVDIDGTSTVGSINQGNWDLSGRHSITVSNRSTVGSITLNLGGSNTVKISDSTVTSGVKMAHGSLTVTNSSIGGITAAKPESWDTTTDGLSITVGTRNQADTSNTGNITRENGNTIIPALTINGGTVGTISDNGDQSKATTAFSIEVWGGETGTRIPQAFLKGGLSEGYLIQKANSWLYTTDFQVVVDNYSSSNSGTGAYRVNDDTAVNDSNAQRVKFLYTPQDSTALADLYITKGTYVKLPTKVNNTTVQYWHQLDNNQTEEALEAGKSYLFPEASETKLSVQLAPNTSNRVIGVEANDKDGTPIGCTLNGTTINLSGAVNTTGNTATITVTFTMNDGNKRYATVGWATDGTITVSKPSNAGEGVVIPTLHGNTVQVYNVSYTFNGSGLRSKVSGISVPANLSSVAISVPNASAGMSGAFVELGKDLRAELIDGTKSSVNFSSADGVKMALNALIAGQTESSVQGIVNQARNAMVAYDNRAKIDGVNTHKVTDAKYTAYRYVVLTPYLEISSSNPTTTTGTAANPILTLNITLKYRYTVTDGTYTAYKDIVNGAKTDWEQTGNLNVTGDYGKVDIKLAMPSNLAFVENSKSYAHHNGYVYTMQWSGNVATISNMNGFSPFVINNTEPAVKIQKKNNGALYEYGFDNLQTAVDVVKDGETIVMHENFTGSINLTGIARKFTLKSYDNNKVTVNLTGVNGASTTYDFVSSSNEYTIQLAANTLTPSGNVAISVVSVANGYARVSASSVKPGSVVTITAVPNAGYAATTPSVRYSTKTAASNVLSLTATGANTWNFTVPADATGVTVTPGFTRITTTNVPFTDVSSTAWYYTGVEYCYNTVRGSARLMQGMNDANTVFSPSSGFTRAQVVQILWNMKGRPAPRNTYNRFSDISSIHYAYNAMLWAVQNGYAEGYPDGTFRPNQYVTRQEMAVFLWRAAGKPTGYNTLNLNNYNDGNQVYDWAQPAMRWAVATGVLSGQGSVSVGRYLAPRAVAYRSEVAVTVMNFDKLAVFR